MKLLFCSLNLFGIKLSSFTSASQNGAPSAIAAMKAAALLMLASVVGAIELTEETWEDKTKGKSVKFFAPDGQGTEAE